MSETKSGFRGQLADLYLAAGRGGVGLPGTGIAGLWWTRHLYDRDVNDAGFLTFRLGREAVAVALAATVGEGLAGAVGLVEEVARYVHLARPRFCRQVAHCTDTTQLPSVELLRERRQLHAGHGMKINDHSND